MDNLGIGKTAAYGVGGAIAMGAIGAGLGGLIGHLKTKDTAPSPYHTGAIAAGVVIGGLAFGCIGLVAGLYLSDDNNAAMNPNLASDLQTKIDYALSWASTHNLVDLNTINDITTTLGHAYQTGGLAEVKSSAMDLMQKYAPNMSAEKMAQAKPNVLANMKDAMENMFYLGKAAVNHAIASLPAYKGAPVTA